MQRRVEGCRQQLEYANCTETGTRRQWLEFAVHSTGIGCTIACLTLPTLALLYLSRYLSSKSYICNVTGEKLTRAPRRFKRKVEYASGC